MTRAKSAVVVGAGAVLVAAVLLPLWGCTSKEPPRISTTTDRAWACEACEHTFIAPNAKGVHKCPKCGKLAAVRSMTYQCGKCGKYFEAYRYLDTTGLESPRGPKGKPIPQGMYFKRKGGQWVEDEEMLGETACPHCGNNDPGLLQLTVPPPTDK